MLRLIRALLPRSNMQVSTERQNMEIFQGCFEIIASFLVKFDLKVSGIRMFLSSMFSFCFDVEFGELGAITIDKAT